MPTPKPERADLDVSKLPPPARATLRLTAGMLGPPQFGVNDEDEEDVEEAGLSVLMTPL